MGVGGSLLDDYVYIDIHDHETSEYRILSTKDLTAEPQLVAERETGIEYSMSEGGDVFYILTNDGDAKDFKIMEAPVEAPAKANWREVVAHTPGTLILSHMAFARHLVWLERKDGLPQIIVRDRKTGEEHAIAFAEEAYSLGLQGAAEYDTDVIRFTYSSMTTPSQLYDYDMTTRERVLLKTQEVPSGHNADDYVTRRVFAPAHDGETVPVTLLYRKDTPLDGSAPCLLYGYGAYGMTIPAGFNTNCLSLADRGFVYAIAHIRGGKDKGFAWYEDGKMEKKTNTFKDFIAAADYLESTEVHVLRKHHRRRRLGRRHADGRDRQHGAGEIRRHHRRRALRRRAQHHARRHAAADPAGMAGMGQPDRQPRATTTTSPATRPTTMSARNPIRRSWRSAASPTRASPTGNRRSGSRGCAKRPPAARRSCSRPTWTPATAALRAASSAWRRSRSNMRSRSRWLGRCEKGGGRLF